MKIVIRKLQPIQPAIFPVLLMVLAFLPSNLLIPIPGFHVASLKFRWVVFFLGVGLVLSLLLLRRDKLSLPKDALIFPIGTLFFVLSLFSSVNPIISVAKLASLMAAQFCVLATTAILTTRLQLYSLLKSLAAIFVTLLIACPFGIVFLPQRGGFEGLNGIFIFSNAMGQFLSIGALPLLLFFLHRQSKRWVRNFIIGLVCLDLLMIVASGSRTAAGIAVILLTAEVLNPTALRSSHRVATRFVLVAVVLAFVVLRVASVMDFSLKYGEGSTLFQSRTSFWADTLDAFSERRLTGYGFGVQQAAKGLSLQLFTSGRTREQASSVLGLLEEVGTLGATPMLIAMFFFSLQNGRRLFFSGSREVRCLAGIIVGGLVWSLTENYLFYLGNGASTIVYISLATVGRAQSLSASEPRP